MSLTGEWQRSRLPPEGFMYGNSPLPALCKTRLAHVAQGLFADCVQHRNAVRSVHAEAVIAASDQFFTSRDT